MKFIKRFFIGLFALLILAGAAVFVLFTFYKKELTALLIENVKSTYGLTLSAKDVQVALFDDWPRGSIKLNDVVLTSDLHAGNEPLLKAGSIVLSFSLGEMLHKKFIVQYVSVSNATVLLHKEIDGENNFGFKKSDNTLPHHSSMRFEIDRVSLRDVQLKFLNDQRGQIIAMNFEDIAIRLKQNSSGVDASLKGDAVVDGLLFNPQKGDFMRNAMAKLDLRLSYIFDKKIVCIYDPSSIEIEKQKYHVTSLLSLGEKRKLAMHIEGNKLKFEKVAQLLTLKIQSVLQNFDVQQPIDGKVFLNINLAEREDPVILAEITGENCDLTIGNSKIPYSKLDFKGMIRSIDSTGRRGDLEKATIIFNHVKGTIYNFPFSASIHVSNLVHPEIAIDAGLLIEAKKIPAQFSGNFVLKGSAFANVKYSGPTAKLNKDEFLKTPMKLDASIHFKNFSYKEPERPYVYMVNGTASLDNQDLRFDNLHVKTDIAEANVKGKAEGFVTYLFGNAKGFSATIAANTEYLDLNPLIAKDGATPLPVISPDTKGKNKKMDQSHFEFNVNLFAKQLVFRKIEGSNANLNLFYKENSLNIKSVSVNTCDGKIAGKAMIKDFNKVDADVTIQNVNVNKLFDEFDNFGQQAIVSDNLRGNIFVDAKFKTDLDNAMKLKPETMAADAKLKLMNGHLINFEPVQNLSNFLFRNRDFNDVTFTELDESFKLRGYQMQINELEIGSNILNLYVVDGLYDFKGNSTINILIPWSNLKRRGKNYIPKNTGESAENTKGVKLNFSGPSNKMKISFGHKDSGTLD